MEDLSYVYDYDIATGKTAKELVSAVKKLLEKEYEPEGQVFSDADGNLCQVMLLWEEDKQK